MRGAQGIVRHAHPAGQQDRARAGQSQYRQPASLYEVLPAAEARRLVERFAWYDTPKHGSWPDSAECELSVLSSQCLDCRFPDKESLIKEVAAWQNNRNKKHAKAIWQFTTADAASS